MLRINLLKILIANSLPINEDKPLPCIHPLKTTCWLEEANGRVAGKTSLGLNIQWNLNILRGSEEKVQGTRQKAAVRKHLFLSRRDNAFIEIQVQMIKMPGSSKTGRAFFTSRC